MNETVKIVQYIASRHAESANYCLDDKGNMYRVEYNKRNELTLIKQELHIVVPENAK